jgi:uncharacterized protein YheU (UPF0270 family)
MSEHEEQYERDDGPSFVLVPATSLSAQALDSLIQEFVTREGTDYGLREYTLEEKTQSVRRQLDRGEVVIAFDLGQQSATLMLRAELPRELDEV